VGNDVGVSYVYVMLAQQARELHRPSVIDRNALANRVRIAEGQIVQFV